MRRWCWYFAMSLALACAFWGAFRHVLIKSPSKFLVCDSPFVNFGTIYDRTQLPLKYAFTVRNASASAIDLSLLQKSCTCTDVYLETPHLLPNAECRISIQWHAPPDDGRYEFRLVVEGSVNDGANKTRIALRGRINISSLFVASANEIDFGDVAPGQEVIRQFTLSGPTSALTGVTIDENLQLANNGVSCIETDSTESTKHFRISIHGPELLQGHRQIAGILRFSTNSPVQPVVDIRIAATSVGRFNLEPPAILIDRSAITSDYPVLLTSTNNEPFEVQSCSAQGISTLLRCRSRFQRCVFIPL